MTEHPHPRSPIQPQPHVDPAVVQILSFTRQTIFNRICGPSSSDPILQCGKPALHTLQSFPDSALELGYFHLHAVPYKDVKECWRRYYTDAALWKVLRIFDEVIEGKCRHGKGDWMGEVVECLDRALILVGAPKREKLVEIVFEYLKKILDGKDARKKAAENVADAEAKVKQDESSEISEDGQRLRKRPKTESDAPLQPCSTIPSYIDPSTLPAAFPTAIPLLIVPRRPLPRQNNPSLPRFQTLITSSQTPFIITNSLENWPALTTHPWSSPSYLLSHTLNGRRLVPLELGRAYTDSTWTQKLVPFGHFLRENLLAPPAAVPPLFPQKTAYLAQHDLFAQIPALRNDILIPDYCYADPPDIDPADNPAKVKMLETKLEEPLLNAWFGPAHTISPLHMDPYHNVLAQVVGYKYIRLYPPSATPNLYPRGRDPATGVDMSNTSSVDLDEAVALFPEKLSPWGDAEVVGVGGEDVEEVLKEQRRLFLEKFPGFLEEEGYFEGVFGPGECVYLPVGWWHYVRSLTVSFSVSFWFD